LQQEKANATSSGRGQNKGPQPKKKKSVPRRRVIRNEAPSRGKRGQGKDGEGRSNGALVVKGQKMPSFGGRGKKSAMLQRLLWEGGTGEIGLGDMARNRTAGEGAELLSEKLPGFCQGDRGQDSPEGEKAICYPTFICQGMQRRASTAKKRQDMGEETGKREPYPVRICRAKNRWMT